MILIFDLNVHEVCCFSSRIVVVAVLVRQSIQLRFLFWYLYLITFRNQYRLKVLRSGEVTILFMFHLLFSLLLLKIINEPFDVNKWEKNCRKLCYIVQRYVTLYIIHCYHLAGISSVLWIFSDLCFFMFRSQVIRNWCNLIFTVSL